MLLLRQIDETIEKILKITADTVVSRFFVVYTLHID